MGRQSGVRGGVVAVALLLGVSGCGGQQSSGGDAKTGTKPAASSSPGSPAAPGGGASATVPAPAPGGGGKPASGDVLPGMVGVAVARTQLAALPVGKPGTMAGYSRDKFTHWAEQGNKCDTREVVLERDGADVTRDSECRAVTGRWKSLYDGSEITEAGKLDIDHMVPLAEAWRSGASGWDAAKRKAFANDLVRPQLLAVSAGSNRSKGDQSPDLWQPTDRSSWCQYGRAWTTVKSQYGLTVTEAERATLTTMLDTCAAS
ncbi:HNH endonuclease family protein [Streptomyces sp. NBC_00249]|uniref:HNH endonuclease family protein n=1 Tax=Streptomyces sp. NBC_00249 TaxID=2975690 RepID=UPI00224D4F69|nr:HNH endonuclease family protein [Streptomyces sp. NBC_00249]MCX5195216.1 HNH endonuclease family protein [Streptomyces sp. NBC_00249]